jgi:hypothetical protein
MRLAQGQQPQLALPCAGRPNEKPGTETVPGTIPEFQFPECTDLREAVKRPLVCVLCRRLRLYACLNAPTALCHAVPEHQG